MCHNMFFPMSLGRYWQLQIFCISLPAILFMAYKTKIEINIKAHIAKTKEAEKAVEKAEGKKAEELTETEKLLKVSFYPAGLNPSVPDSLICVGSSWHQISAIRPLRRYCRRLEDRKMSRVVSKRRAAVFLIIN